MKTIASYFTAAASLLFGRAVAQDLPVTPPVNFYTLSFTTISGEKFDFNQLKGKKVLIVNTASKCGFTPQFEELEALHKKYQDKLVILGFPSNDFGSQDPGTNNEIQSFCQVNYGVSFQMMDKSPVKGKEKNPVYIWLSSKAKNGWNEQEPTWNFCKYLIDENGHLIGFFPSKVKPMDKEIISRIE